MSHSLFQVLSFDERILVLSDIGANQVYTWNRSCTYQVWTEVEPGRWEESAIRTRGRETRDFDDAKKYAQAWFVDNNSDE